jgi:hypothetical protein
MPLNRLAFRKQIFDFLKVNLTDCEIVIEHPTGLSANKPKIVVESVMDAALGLYNSPSIENGVIRITMYTETDLQLTKPLGLLTRVNDLMITFCPNPECNFHRINGSDIAYISDLAMHFAYITYRFYSAI